MLGVLWHPDFAFVPAFDVAVVEGEICDLIMAIHGWPAASDVLVVTDGAVLA
ncbi:MAG: hypothetical protein ACYSUD_04840 [Planctomycetota bacterium]|jgi:hypothetical protein